MAVAVAMVAAAPALAQTTTAAVAGRVVDVGGQPVAGATVTIVHVESKATSSTVTDAEGRWSARGLRVGGPYTVTVAKGADRESREGVFLALNETLALDLQLGAPARLVITGSRVLLDRFGSGNMGAGTAIGAGQVAALPSFTGNLQDLARVDPRISQTDKERGEISALGQNSRFNTVTIDGVSVSDTFGLEANNLPTSKQPISIYAIQSLQVNLANYDVTQRGYTGANINAVTKSGTNDFHGTVYYRFRNQDWAGRTYNRSSDTYSDPLPFKEVLSGFALGGPIVPDKLFFFVGYEEFKSSKAGVDFGPVGSGITNVNITPASIDALRSAAATTWGIDLGTIDRPANTFLSVKDALVKLDWSISEQQRATLRYTRTEQSEPFFPDNGTRALSLTSHWYDQKKTLDTTVAQWFADWTPSFSTEARLSYRDYASEPQNRSQLPLMAFDFGGAGTGQERTLFTGTERSRHFNKLFTKTWDAFGGATWTLGDHELRLGGEYSQNKIYNAFLQDAYGQYKFQCDNAFTYTTTTLTGGSCATATAAEWQAAVLENFTLGRATSYQAQLPLPGKTLGDGVAGWQLNNYGLFAQDTWKPMPKLSLSLGARVDIIDMPDQPIANAAAGAAVVPGTVTGLGTGTRQTGGFGYDNTVTPDGDTLVQPRLGFNWDLGDKERKLQLRGGLGLFQGAAANVWISNPYSNTGVAMAFYGCGTSAELTGGTNNRAACATTGVFNPNIGAQPALGTNPASNVDFLDPSLTQPSVWKMNLAIDAELPWFGLVAGAELVHTKVKNGIYYQHLNLGPATGTGSDGRPLFYNANGYNTNCWSAAGAVTSTAAGCGGTVTSRALNNSGFGNVMLATGTGKGGGDALTLALAQQPAPGLLWQLAYTRTSAKEVSPLTSSVAFSNWAARSVFNPNEEVAADSAYLVRDRVNATMSFSRAIFNEYKTTFGLTYEGRRGKPYSWTYYNDLNGDGSAGNDLMYVPSAPGSGEVVFAGGAAEEARFWDIVNTYSELSGARGGVVSRNSGRSPWVNTIDLRIAQELPGFTSGHKARVKLDILNFGNFLNPRYGHTDEVAFQSAGGQARSFVNYKGRTADGRYIYSLGALEDLTTRQAKGESQWAAQLTFEYEF
ncbi:MAG: TonB-dependent receptor [Burkholderiales bacterium]|nr:TonB-dependent receptor [Burkholderiales bacterium]